MQRHHHRTATSTPALSVRSRSARASRGFTMTEMLIVIGLIVLLIGILLPALGAVQRRARITRTTALMQDFANACEVFSQEHGFLPGVIPEDVLANDPKISGTENALLHLMGGFAVLRPTDPAGSDAEIAYNNFVGTELTFTAPLGGTWRLKVNITDFFGLGPVIDGKQYGPYFTAGRNDLKFVPGKVGQNQIAIPDLVDAWDMPIMYLRRARGVGPLVGPLTNPAPQFIFPAGGGALRPYIQSTALGERGVNQTSSGGNSRYSILNATGSASSNGGYSVGGWNLMMLLANEAFRVDLGGGNADYNAARGSFVLISAGVDNIYFATDNGAGSTSNPQEEILRPTIVGEYDDIVVVGGGSR